MAKDVGYCPFKYNPETLNTSGMVPEGFYNCRCEKEKCAWWYDPEYCCSIKLIAGNLFALK